MSKFDFTKPTHVEYKDVTQDIIKNMGYKNYSHFFISRNYDNVYFGMIAWDDTTEQYCFYPITESQIKLPSQILGELYEKIYMLMADRNLN